nr:hypothetical protein BaRGS_024713 [Batillaria attramentaria]
MTTAASGSAEEGRTTCWSVTKEHVRRELWSYLALFGLLYLYLGIIICVYALKGVFAQRWIMTLCGVFLSGAGGVHLVISWLCYRHHKRHHKFKCCGGDKDDDDAVSSPPPKKERVRPRGQSLAGFLTPEFAKYAEFSARDRRYDSKRQHFFRAYDPTQISISFAHR